MRAVCFVERIEFEFSGNVFKNAITLGDVDNDGHSELIIGSSDGDILIFKGDKCWQKLSGLGMVSAIGVGDVMNCGSNALIVICGDGWCHIYLSLQPKTEELEESNVSGKLQRIHIQRIPPNTKMILLGDIDNDGKQELVMGLTDRVVRSYRWHRSVSGGKLVCLNKWECARQIGSLTLNHGPQAVPYLLISQPGGTYMRIRTEALNNDENNKEEKSPFASVDYHPLSSNKMRNPNISSEIFCVINVHYILKIPNNIQFHVNFVLRSMQVDHRLFALNKLDVTGDGRDEIIACSWDGQTYIIDQSKHSVSFQLEESVAGFCAGMYSISTATSPVPCLIYTTFSNKVYIYHNVKLASLASKSLMFKVVEQKDTINEICAQDVVSDKKKLKALIEWCLYNKHSL
ncbi:KICSTOR complex protein ITFG2 [Nilaparvata lugens]|uniref:KICSTOR complex protein ITFG2 n=1 Tax=Nilaparvata lugens TaxID=108931 RepID=UPI00193D667A|nr:KICSTOR complex protein ITFG2 [Nilaparvata lugens]